MNLIIWKKVGSQTIIAVIVVRKIRSRKIVIKLDHYYFFRKKSLIFIVVIFNIKLLNTHIRINLKNRNLVV